MLIARFYQRFSGQRKLFALYIIPVLLFGIQAVREAKFARDWVANLLGAAGGITLLVLSLFLYRRMTTGR